MDTSGLGLRERKKLQCRQAMADAALELAEGHGPERVTVDAISEAAGVSPRTFFNYFASKEEAILDIDPRRTQDVVAHLAARPADEAPLEALRQVLSDSVHSRLEYLDAWRRRAELVERHESLLPRYLAGFAEREQLLTDALAERLGVDAATDPYPRLTVAAALSCLRVAVATWQRSGFGDDLPARIETAFDHVAHGLALPVTARRGTS